MWTDPAWEDYLSWQDEPKMQERIQALIALSLIHI